MLNAWHVDCGAGCYQLHGAGLQLAYDPFAFWHVYPGTGAPASDDDNFTFTKRNPIQGSVPRHLMCPAPMPYLSPLVDTVPVTFSIRTEEAPALTASIFWLKKFKATPILTSSSTKLVKLTFLAEPTKGGSDLIVRPDEVPRNKMLSK